MNKETLAEFWSKVDIHFDTNMCWEWKSGKDGRGYGAFKGLVASRISLSIKLNRPIKNGYQSLHTCDNKACVNPYHLYEGTQSDNMRDTWERNPSHRDNLTKKVYSVKNRINSQKGYPFREKIIKDRKEGKAIHLIAKDLGISRVAVTTILLKYGKGLAGNRTMSRKGLPYKKEIIKNRKDGLSIQAIAEKLGLTRQSVTTIIKNYM